MLPIFGLELLYNVLALGYCNLFTYGNEEVAFIRRRSCEPLKWRQFAGMDKRRFF
jgi:hypothetical protein